MDEPSDSVLECSIDALREFRRTNPLSYESMSLEIDDMIQWMERKLRERIEEREKQSSIRI